MSAKGTRRPEVTNECVSTTELVPHQLQLFRVSASVTEDLGNLIPPRKRNTSLKCSLGVQPMPSLLILKPGYT